MTEISFDVDYVRRTGLPAICAKTGVPTRGSYGQTLYNHPIWNNWIFLVVDVFVGLVLRATVADGVKVGIPLARRLRWRRGLCGWTAVLALLLAGWSALQSLAEQGWETVAFASLAVAGVAYAGYRTAHVRVRRHRDVVWMRVHPALAQAIRDDIARTRPDYVAV